MWSRRSRTEEVFAEIVELRPKVEKALGRGVGTELIPDTVSDLCDRLMAAEVEVERLRELMRVAKAINDSLEIWEVPADAAEN